MGFNYVKSLLIDPSMNHYLVDSDFRTVAQGWARADQTGPLDLWSQRNPGYVYRTGDYTTDVACWNAARDAMVDYRGDTLYLTPGAYSLAATTWDVFQATITGRAYNSPARGCSRQIRNTTITTTGATGITLGADADGLEVSYLRFVPLTAGVNFLVNAAAPYLHFHDFMWDCDGITADVTTNFLQTTTTAQAISFSCFDHFVWFIDAPQGPVFNWDVASQAVEIANFQNFVTDTAGTYITSLLDMTGVDGHDGYDVHDGFGVLSNGGGAGAVTELILSSTAQTGAPLGNVSRFVGSVAYSTATGLINEQASGDWDIAESFIGVVPGGTHPSHYTS